MAFRGVLVGLWLVLSACGDGPPPGKSDEGPFLVSTPTPAEHVEGEAQFAARCQACHGIRGSGSINGPPLVHAVYEPGHHADASFYRAVEFGVRAHHWRFGRMPPVSDVSRSQVTAIIGYVRWLQREAGLF